MTMTRSERARWTVAQRALPARVAANPLARVLLAYWVPVTAFAVHLALVFAVASAGVAWFVQRPIVPAVGYYLLPMQGLAHYLIEPLRNWDGFWYTLIAERGYEAHPATAAFWPLYPLLLNVVQSFTDWSIPLAGVVVSNVAFLGALVLLYRLVRLDYGEAVAGRTVWLLALFPTAYYFSAVYTESLFLLLTVAAVYYARTAHWGRAAVAAFLAGLTRNTGVLVLLPVGLLLVRRYGWHPRGWWREGLQVACAALAPLLFLWHLDSVWGDPLLTVHVQKQWLRYQAMPWDTIATGIRRVDLSWLDRLIASPSWATLTAFPVRHNFAESQFYDVFITLLFLPLALYMLRRIRFEYSLYALIAFVLPMFSPSQVHPLMSMPRFVLVLFPFFIALARLLRNRWLYGAALALSVIQFAGLLIQFSTWFWVA
ncbi:MAG: hypothetical protein IRY97_05935 [Thermomicrobiaceae bacterium]|nr:hypothetical protein [Thermomicrobiaceae bacterium]